MVNAELLQTVDEGELNKMKVAELRTELKQRGEPTVGLKDELVLLLKLKREKPKVASAITVAVAAAPLVRQPSPSHQLAQLAIRLPPRFLKKIGFCVGPPATEGNAAPARSDASRSAAAACCPTSASAVACNVRALTVL